MTSFSISTFGKKFGADNGLLQLMDDLGRYAGRPGMMMLGGGNPSRIPAVETYFQEEMVRLLDSASDFEDLISTYTGPAGYQPLIDALVDFFNRQYGWGLTADNVVLTNGSQSAFFNLFNLFAGDFPDGSFKKILLPLAPEYIGYTDAGIKPGIFKAYRPEIDFLPERQFKYRVDFKALQINDEIGAICVSRPTNPTGNVLTSAEIEQLDQLAQAHNLPLIIDNAYGLPFPNIIFSDIEPIWKPHIILSMSLSKLGLPGARTGILIAHEEIARRLISMNAVISLAPGGFGGALVTNSFRNGEVLRISREEIRPHYEKRVAQAVNWFQQALDGVEYYLHKPEGGIFIWAWFKGLPISSQQLYDRLKERNVLIIPGENFFPGLEDDPWPHKTECIRVSYAGDPETVRTGIEIIGEEVRKAFGESRSLA